MKNSIALLRLAFEIAQSQNTRRITYVDVGNLSKSKAEQYLKDMIQMHHPKRSTQVSTSTAVYDSVSGNIVTDSYVYESVPPCQCDKQSVCSLCAGGENPLPILRHVSPSGEEELWFPRREGGHGTKTEIQAGFTNVDTVLKIADKLHQWVNNRN